MVLDIFRNAKQVFAIALWAVVAIGLCAGWSASSVPARETLSIDQLTGQATLAECNVVELQAKKQESAMPEQVVFRMNTDLPEDVLEYYARSRDGQWLLHEDVADDDPWIRLLVLSPQRPVLVDVAVTVDGKSFRETRKRWVELLLSQAKGNYGARDQAAPAAEVSAEVESASGTKVTKESSEGEGAAKSLASQVISETAEAAKAAGEALTDAKDTLKETLEAADEAAEPLVGIRAERRVAPSVIKRLKNYVAAMGDEVDVEEIRWLLADWAGGPGLLVLGPGVSWKRSEVAPLWSWLDKDQDHELGSDELDDADLHITRADFNEDDIVSLSEFYRTEQMTSPYARAHSHPLLVVLDGETDWNVLFDDLEDAYGSSPFADSPAELRMLLDEPAEIAFAVTLGPKGKVELLKHDETNTTLAESTVPSENKITVNLGGLYFELSAVYRAAQGTTIESPQVAVGATVDGFPLMRLLDTDNDQRITRPERRRLAGLLTRLDTNQDRRIDAAEVPTAIRMEIANGPFLHERFRSRAVAVHVPKTTEVELPEWFKNMDRNGDGELSRKEFPGLPEQFRSLDRDNNGIISGQEVQDSVSSGE